MDYAKRLHRLLDELESRGLDSFFVTEESNVTYLSGFEGHDSFLFIMPGKRYLLTDSRYIEEAEDTARGFKVAPISGTVYQAVSAIAAKHKLRRIGFESASIPYQSAMRLKEELGKSRLAGISGLIEHLRSEKDAHELRLIRRSVAITRGVLRISIARLRPGITEKAVADGIEIEFIKKDARPSFELIVASGTNSSKPHARPSDRKISKNDFVMIDIGCTADGYSSDMTRMAVVGKASAKFKKIYNIVREAQERAIAKIRAGATVSEVDYAARSFIHKNGFGSRFGHALGHGIGLGVHEAPSISKSNQALLKSGMVFTVEPAIYIPGFGGVRIEDMVLVTNSGCEVLTR